ncbi:prolyl oligopeptidase family serine peptidase [Qipengyuania sp. 6B39]|uniref:S9 family peptidase n=1 Tax=Qipengyuania proteolytica TaxID=2867239 RepID=UPI001C8AEAE0|nr:prolyl oligopeptidase family serine peptidase [Qipengyuania proteolytica]MBX7496530.1 prolyl oligopeptidase family serine peptidase [Qipengyuania proteolytica]
MLRVFRVAAPLVLLCAAPAVAQGAGADAASASADIRPQPIDLSAFAKRSPFSHTRLSPNGKVVVTKAVVDGGHYVALIDPADNKLIRRYSVGGGNEIKWVRWAGNNKLLVSLTATGQVFGDEMQFSRLTLVELDTGNMQVLGEKYRTIEGDNLVHVADDGSFALVAIQRTIYDYPSVVRYELTKGGETDIVQRPIEGVWTWVADDAGVVRLGMGYHHRALRIYYRDTANDKFRLIEKIKEGEFEEKFWDVSQIVSGSSQGYVLREGESGRVGLYLYDLSTREPIETVYEHPEYDLDGVIWRDDKPLGVYYTDDRDRVHWFDPEYDKLYQALGSALGEEEVWVASRAEDDSRMIVWAGGAADPGAYYTFTPAEKRLDLFMELRPQIDETQLAKPRPVTYTARDGTKIRAYLTLPRGREAKDLPLVILPHGGPYGVRDKLDYNSEVQVLANRGYAVLQPNFRGSGGYGEAFFELGTGQIGRAMQDDLDDAMDWAVKEGIASKDRVCVVGSSYGGYAALWSVIRNPERYRCAASFAGVTDWDLMLKYDRRFFSRDAGKKWAQRVEGEEEFDLDTVSPYRLAGTLSRPVLVAHGKLDSNVPISQFNKFKNAAKNAPVVPVELVFEDEGHGFDKPENEQKWYEALLDFLAQHNPAD